MKEKLNEATMMCGVTALTEAWDEVSFEELEERLELDSCSKFTCDEHWRG